MGDEDKGVGGKYTDRPIEREGKGETERVLVEYGQVH